VLTVIPFRAGGKSRLPEELRREVALAMLGDVVEAAVSTGDVRVVTGDAAGRLVATDLGAEVVDDPGEGQSAAVAAGLDGMQGLCRASGPRISMRWRSPLCSASSESSKPVTERRTRSACRTRRSSPRSTARAAPASSARTRRRSASTSRN
jgi:hypothetical protein